VLRVPQAPIQGLKPGQGAALAGIFFSAMAVFLAPLVLGPVGFVLGGIAYYRGERRARWIIVAAIVCIGLGLLLDALPDKFVMN
jgi:hypothetical protein